MSDEPLFLFAAANIAQELISEICPLETVLIPKQVVAILNISETFSERNLQDAAETLRQTILKVLKHSVTAPDCYQLSSAQTYSLLRNEPPSRSPSIRLSL
ncbi:hypothetical protein [Paenibacillus planticolens]|uniref:hypothetical protein n=1 Tax=Paenibacillus planticolens TaxID=2654976 RepID=UPI0014922942|nr:hypothetical protein [Paenibacillus planticolens]